MIERPAVLQVQNVKKYLYLNNFKPNLVFLTFLIIFFAIPVCSFSFLSPYCLRGSPCENMAMSKTTQKYALAVPRDLISNAIQSLPL